ncbi:GNAT family N-acetyltransferase [Pseudorhodoplanes sp.]|uniref:GNAT family N-acetyltransferase n=1 Tax=Pseudorhodoplanes sp. TaxID=1934341 RepID=UPI002CC28FEC|nr:GNAT family N-acetyltransferase [Pseudorhodoplanes sp.]HWV55734.1 GNAT family N-acetyltransferase [Pseudorhodoplanes sp.]
MIDRPESYSAIETLRDGRRVEIRALKPDDRSALESAIDRTSPHSLYRRFFAVKTTFSEAEAHYFVDIDFTKHVALVAVVGNGNGQAIVAGGRYVLIGSDAAEIAFTVIDAYQGQGLGTILLRHLIAIARSAGLKQFVAEVLSENQPMLDVFEHCGVRMSARSADNVTHVTLDL